MNIVASDAMQKYREKNSVSRSSPQSLLWCPLSYLLLFQVSSPPRLLDHATLGKPLTLAGLTHVSGVCLLQNFWKILKGRDYS